MMKMDTDDNLEQVFEHAKVAAFMTFVSLLAVLLMKPGETIFRIALGLFASYQFFLTIKDVIHLERNKKKDVIWWCLLLGMTGFLLAILIVRRFNS